MNNDQIQLAFERCGKALTALEGVLGEPMLPNRVVTDATIQRFEFTVELFWKLLKKLVMAKGTEVVFPKDVLRAAYAGHLIDDENAWIDMLDDRNMTSHTYNEELADEIYERIKVYCPVLRKTFEKLKKQFDVV
jgi:nucleotidyltransferase substrate binding protein (TIGR01987 family)